MEKIISSVGRRKEAVTQIFVKKGSGKITVNGKDYKEYFPLHYLQNQIELPLKTLPEAAAQYDFSVNAKGGGQKGQAEAIKLGIARIFCQINADAKPLLKKEGFLTRDARAVERKKPGRKKARRRFQFVKR